MLIRVGFNRNKTRLERSKRVLNNFLKSLLSYASERVFAFSTADLIERNAGSSFVLAVPSK